MEDAKPPVVICKKERVRLQAGVGQGNLGRPKCSDKSKLNRCDLMAEKEREASPLTSSPSVRLSSPRPWNSSLTLDSSAPAQGLKKEF